ncbi:MAG: hypothetical protein KBA30_00215 [Clostridia bacterium]|nr:hypothetical protein [Clostridia bacterium]
MMTSFDKAKEMIGSGKWLHISGNEDLLKELPKGNWIGGSTEYFMDSTGGTITNSKLFVQEIPYSECRISTYDTASISGITKDAYANGFSIIILPFDSEVHKEYAKHATEYEDIFLKNIIGWVAGVNLSVAGQTPIAVDGATGEAYSDKAVVMHVGLPDDKLATIGIVNIFTQDDKSPIIEFSEDSFSVRTCLVDGKEHVFSDYIAKNKIDTKLPLVGEYSGTGVNVSVKAIEDGIVHLYAPVFKVIKYRMASPVLDYSQAFRAQIDKLSGNTDSTFSCNCILNFLYGELEGKKVQTFFGPITFGEIAYQLVNQTLVYLQVI